MIKSWKIIKDAWTGSLLELVGGIIGTALGICALIIFILLGGSML